MTTQNYALVLFTRSIDDPFQLFREVDVDGDYRTEVYDREAGEWVRNMAFTKYTQDGEVGAVPISTAKTEEIISRNGGERSADPDPLLSATDRPH